MGRGGDPTGDAEGERLRAFAELARALAHAGSVDEVSQSVTDHLGRALGAAFANLALVEPAGDAVRILNPVGLDPAVAARYRTLPLEASSPLTDAVRTGETVVVESPAANRDRYPHLSEEAAALGLEALAAVPIHADGAVFGALGVGWTRPFTDFRPRTSRLTAIGALVSGAIERARTADTHAALVTALQAIVLPELPERPGLEIAARYQPAGRGLGFGGDWYDVVALDDHRTAVIVGDVVGHGIEAAARMVQVRSALHAVVRLGVPLTEVFSRAAPVIGADGHLIGSAVVAVVDRGAGTVEYARAGHPPLVVVGPDGRARLLDDASSVVLGLTMVEGPAGVAPFPPGSVLLAYTDGLVELRAAGIEAGIDRMVADLEAACSSGGPSGSVGAVATRVLAGAGDPADLEDDVALVVVRHLAAAEIPD